jgi:hypothetical protein
VVKPAPSRGAPAQKGGLSVIPLNVPLPRASQSSSANKHALTAKEMLSARAKAAASSSKAKPKAEGEAHAPAAFDAADVGVDQQGAKDALRAAGDRAAALVDAWLGASNAAAIVAVSEADDVPGAARKAARRAVNVLRARGVTIPERHVVVRIDDKSEVSIEATMIPPDASGTFSLSVTSRDASGRYHLAEVIIREPAGIVQAGSGWLSGSQIKEGRTRALEGLGVAPVAVPLEWARHRIAASRKLNAASGQILPLGLDACRELVEPTSEAEPAHPVDDLETSLTSERASAAALGSAGLHQEPEMRAWLPDRGALDEMLQKVGERLGADGARDPERVSTALKEEVDAATDRFFSPEVRAIVASRLRDAAISVRARRGDRRAEDVIAVARAVREAGLITSPPREIPFLIGFFQKALGILAQQGGGQLRVPVAQGGSSTEAQEG